MSSQELQEQTNRASELSCFLGWDNSAPPEAMAWDLLPSADNSLTPIPASHSSPVAIQIPGKSLPPWTLRVLPWATLLGILGTIRVSGARAGLDGTHGHGKGRHPQESKPQPHVVLGPLTAYGDWDS